MLEFEPISHVYTLDGIQIPSVSEVLRFASRELYGDTSAQAMEIAADRGTRVHAATEALDRNGSADVDPDIEPYVRAYAKFLRDNKINWRLIETHVVSMNRDYAGTIDRLGWLNEEKVLLDIKTTKTITARHKKLYAAQLTAYRDCCTDSGYILNGESFPIEKLVILQLKNNEGYELHIVEPEEEVWQGCLALHKTFTPKRRKKKNG